MEQPTAGWVAVQYPTYIQVSPEARRSSQPPGRSPEQPTPPGYPGNLSNSRVSFAQDDFLSPPLLPTQPPERPRDEMEDSAYMGFHANRNPPKPRVSNLLKEGSTAQSSGFLRLQALAERKPSGVLFPKYGTFSQRHMRGEIEAKKRTLVPLGKGGHSASAPALGLAPPPLPPELEKPKPAKLQLPPLKLPTEENWRPGGG